MLTEIKQYNMNKTDDKLTHITITWQWFGHSLATFVLHSLR